MTRNLTTEQIDYYRVATKLAMTLGRKFAVNIVFNGVSATDGETVYLPHWDITDPAKRLALYGVIAHEAGGHVRMTDFIHLKNRSKTCNPHPEWMTFLNILEDIRIEANLSRIYPGFRCFVDEAIKILFHKEHCTSLDTQSYWAAAQNWCLVTFRKEMLGQDFLNDLQKVTEDLILTALSPEILVKARSIAAEVASLNEEKDTFSRVCHQADALLTLFDQARPSQQPQPQDNSQDDAKSGGADASPSTSSNPVAHDASNASSNSGASNQAGSEPSSGEGISLESDAATNPAQQAGQTADANGEPDPSGQNGKGKTASALSGDAKSQANAGTVLDESLPGLPCDEYDVTSKVSKYCQKGNSNRPFSAGSSSCPGDTVMQNITGLLGDATRLRSGIVASLSPLLLGEAEVTDHKYYGRRLDARRIARLRLEVDAPVFQRRIVDEDQQVAFMLLVDTSGSTFPVVIDHLYIGALGVCLALESFPDVETSIAHFPPRQKSGMVISGIRSIKPIGIQVSKTLGTWPCPSGGTPLDKAYYTAGFQLLASDKQRKILLTLTDGRPDDPDEASDAAKFLSELGIETYGLVVSEKHYPKGIFLQSEQITNASEAPAALARLVKKIL